MRFISNSSNYNLSILLRLMIFGASFSLYFKSINPRNINSFIRNAHLRVLLHKDIGERAPEISSIYIALVFLRGVHILTPRTENLIFSIRTLTLEILNWSDIPIGTSLCLSQSSL